MKQISLRLEERQYDELKSLGEIYNKDYSQIIREGIDTMINKLMVLRKQQIMAQNTISARDDCLKTILGVFRTRTIYFVKMKNVN